MSGTATADVFSGDPSKKFDVVFGIDMRQLLTGLGMKPADVDRIMATAEANSKKTFVNSASTFFASLRTAQPGQPGQPGATGATGATGAQGGEQAQAGDDAGGGGRRGQGRNGGGGQNAGGGQGRNGGQGRDGGGRQGGDQANARGG